MLTAPSLTLSLKVVRGGWPTWPVPRPWPACGAPERACRAAPFETWPSEARLRPSQHKPAHPTRPNPLVCPLHRSTGGDFHPVVEEMAAAEGDVEDAGDDHGDQVSRFAHR